MWPTSRFYIYAPTRVVDNDVAKSELYIAANFYKHMQSVSSHTSFLSRLKTHYAKDKGVSSFPL